MLEPRIRTGRPVEIRNIFGKRSQNVRFPYGTDRDFNVLQGGSSFDNDVAVVPQCPVVFIGFIVLNK
jgi:hypothetical protein